VVIDSSAILAVLLGEPEAERLARAIATDSRRLIGVVSVLASAVVIETRKGAEGVRALDQFLQRTRTEISAMNADQFELARNAYSVFGKGRHPAGLNLGDCCSYALARYSGEPLLFAAIWDVWAAPGGRELAQIATVTTEPNADVRDIHHRMGAILETADVAAWLDGDEAAARALLRPLPDGSLAASALKVFPGD